MSETKQISQLTGADERSFFDGSFWGLLGHNLLTAFVTSLTFGIAYPWMLCWKQRWIAKHTVVCGKRTRFDGTGGSLIGNYLLWVLLSMITCGIYGFWFGINMKKWVTKHTHYDGEADNNSYFDGGLGGYIGIHILSFLLTACTCGFAAPWAEKKVLEWEASHTVIDNRRHVFVGTGGSLFVKRLVWGLLTGITCGIFAFWIPINMRKWTCENTIDTEHTTDALIRRGEYRAGVQATAANLHTQRVQDEMELIQCGVTAATDEATLLSIAQSGSRSAQFAYAQRFPGEHYAEFLKASALQGYAPAMYAYATSGLCSENITDLLSGAAKNGQIPAALQLMRNAAQVGLAEQNEAAAVASLEEAVRWYDILVASEEAVTEADTQVNEQCMQKLRWIRTKTPPKSKLGAIILLSVLAVVLLSVLVGVIAALFLKVAPSYDRKHDGGYVSGEYVSGVDGSYDDEEYAPNADSGYVGGNEASSSSQSFFSRFFSSLFGSQMDDFAVRPGISQEDYVDANGDQSAYGNGTGVNGNSFLDAFRSAMENDPQFYSVESLAAGDGREIYALKCSHYYWVSYFEMTLWYRDSNIYRIDLTGPRIYETIDESINGLEFQGITRVLYSVLGLPGDPMEIYTVIDAGTDHTVDYGSWQFHHVHTGDTLTLEITAK